jgi:hypothetical protein
MTDSTDQAVHKKRERDEEEPPTSCQLPKLPRTDAEPDNLDASVRIKLNDMIASGLVSPNRISSLHGPRFTPHPHADSLLAIARRS